MTIHSCPFCQCVPHRAMLDWTSTVNNGTAWLGVCSCGWRSAPFVTWQQAMSSAKDHAAGVLTCT